MTQTPTPGPWETRTEHKNSREGITIWAHDLIIADVVPDQHDNEEANARLIASAPLLLAELKNIIGWLEKKEESTSKSGVEYGYVTMAKQVIVKAEGKEIEP